MTTLNARESLTPDPTKLNGRDPRLDMPRAPDSPTPDPILPKTAAPTPLRAAHTPNFPALLRNLGASLLVTTYQAGKLVMLRDEGDHLNTHYRTFKAPMAKFRVGLSRGCGGLSYGAGLLNACLKGRPSALARTAKNVKTPAKKTNPLIPFQVWKA